MEFTADRVDDTTVFVIAAGQITSGDAERLMGVFLPLPRDGTSFLVLNSIGGSVVASEALAAAIHRLGVPVIVPATGVCASACFILFAASPNKYYIPGARIGVHSATEGGHETLDSMGVTTAMARSAAEMGVPDAIVGRMVRTPPGSVAWLSEAELLAMGAVRIDITTPPPAPSVPPDTPLTRPVPDNTTTPSGPIALSHGPVGSPAPAPLHIIGGGSNGGCIVGAVGLPPQGDGYQTIHGSLSYFWGAPVTIQNIVTLGQEAHANGLPPLLIGDISRPSGGTMPGGRVAHQVGLDVDVALDMHMRGYLSEEQRESIQIASLVRSDARDIEPSMWGEAVARLLWLAATLPGVDRLLVNPAIKQQLCRTVTGDRSWLRFVRPWYGYAAHMNVSFKCPPGQTDCVAKAPPPPGDGCDATLQWWFDQLDAPKPPPGPPKARSRLPEACYSLLGPASP
jgi:penicillin-insensitive murein endopeptidase